MHVGWNTHLYPHNDCVCAIYSRKSSKYQSACKRKLDSHFEMKFDRICGFCHEVVAYRHNVLMQMNGSLLTTHLTRKFAIIEALNENRCSILSTIKIRTAKRIRAVRYALLCFAFYLVFLYCSLHVIRG